MIYGQAVDPHEPVELDARLAWALSLGWQPPDPDASAEERQALKATIETLRVQADAGATIATSREAIAVAVAELAEVNAPTRPETVELLSELVLDIHRSEILNGREVYVIGLLHDFGWPIDPETRLNDNVVAAADLGLFDPPHPVPASHIPTSGTTSERDADGKMTVRITFGRDKTAFERAADWRAAQEDPPEPRSVNEQFLYDWEFLLGSIVDVLTDALAQNMHLDIGPG
jgi:hypothetical protein